jgi:hypothetical protein
MTAESSDQLGDGRPSVLAQINSRHSEGPGHLCHQDPEQLGRTGEVGVGLGQYASRRFGDSRIQQLLCGPVDPMAIDDIAIDDKASGVSAEWARCRRSLLWRGPVVGADSAKSSGSASGRLLPDHWLICPTGTRWRPISGHDRGWFDAGQTPGCRLSWTRDATGELTSEADRKIRQCSSVLQVLNLY